MPQYKQLMHNKNGFPTMATSRITSTAILLTMLFAVPTSSRAQDEKPIAPVDAKLGRPVDFDKDVYPVLEANCIACHNRATNESDLVLETAEDILKGGSSGPAAVAGKPDESLLFLVATRKEEPVMPPLPNDVKARSLTGKQLGIVKQWIVEGAKPGSGRTKTLAWQPLPQHLSAIYATALSAGGHYAAAGRANRITVYDLVSGTEAARLSDRALMTIQQSGNPMYGPTAAHRDFVHSLAFSPDGNMLASGGYRNVKLWQRQTGNVELKIEPGQNVTASANHGEWIAYALADSTVRIQARISNEKQKAGAKAAIILKGHSGAINSVEFSNDGKTILTGSEDKTVRLWSVADGKQLASFETPSPVKVVSLNSDSKLAFTAGTDNVIRKWTPQVDKSTFVAAGELKGHGKPVRAFTRMPTANQLASASEDGNARIWDTAKNKQIRAYPLGSPANSMAISPDASRLAVTGQGGSTKIFNVKDGKVLFELKTDVATYRSVQTTTATKTIADQRVALADAAVKATEKDLKSREAAVKKAVEAKDKAAKAIADPEKKNTDAIAALKKGEEALKAKPEDAALKKKVADEKKKADAATAALKGAKDALAASERAVKLANEAVAKSKEQLKLRNDKKAAEVKLQTDAVAKLNAANELNKKPLAPAVGVAFSPNGKALLVASNDQKIRLWNVSNGQPLETIPLATAKEPAKSIDLAFVDTTKFSVTTANQTRVIDTNPGWKLIATLGPTDPAKPNDVSRSKLADRVLALGFSNDGKKLATGGGEASRSGELIVWDVKSKKPVREIVDAHSDTVFAARFSADDKFLLSGAADKFVKIFDLATGKHVRSYEGHTHHVMAVDWKADGATIASASADNVIKVWNVETGEQRRTISGYSKQVTSLQFIGTTAEIISGSGDKTVRRHNSSNGKSVRTYGGSTDYVFSVNATNDSTGAIVVAGGQDGVLRVWNGKDAKVLHSFAPPKTAENTQVSK